MPTVTQDSQDEGRESVPLISDEPNEFPLDFETHGLLVEQHRRSSANLSQRRLSDVEPTGTISSSCTNIVNTILGAGMLAMPKALASVGLGFGVFMIFFCGLASGFGLFLLSRVAAEVGRKSSFYACAKITYPKAALWIDMAIAIKCFGVSVSYLIICGDLLPQVCRSLYSHELHDKSFLASKTVWITICTTIITPIAFLRKLDSLRYTSAFALLGVVYLLVLVVVFFVFPPASGMPYPPVEWKDIVWIKIDSHFFANLPIFVFAFTCHQNIFSVYNELVDNRPVYIERVIMYSIFIAVTVYQVIGIVGYLTFGNGVTANVIALYPPGSVVTCGQLAIATLVLLSYPLQCHPCRASLDRVLTRGAAGSSIIPTARFNIMTTAIIILSYVVAISVDNLATMLSLVGATGSTTIAYILPGLFYYRMKRNTRPQGVPMESLEYLALFQASWGVFVMVTSLATQLLQASGTVLH